MENETKKNDYAKNVELEFYKVSSEVFNQEIKKITFETSKGQITWKPKVEHKQYINGMECVEKIPMKLGDMPEELISFNKTIAESPKTKVLCSYSIMNTEMDGEPKTYRFIVSMKQFLEWKILKDEVKTERIA